jgi:CHAD domain-containing protein
MANNSTEGAKLSSLRFDLPDKFNEQKVVEALVEHYPLKNEASVSAKLTYFDTFDWRLYNNSLVLHRSENELFLSRLGNNIILRQKISTLPVFIQDFPQGTLKKQLASIVEMRALFELVEICAQLTSYRVLNSDEKTVAWLLFEKVTPTRRKDIDPSPLQVSVKPVRGYADFKAVAQQLLHMGCLPSEKDTYLLALESVGRQPGDYTSKLEVQLEPHMRSDEAAKRLLRAMLKVMQQNEEYVKKDIDTEFLHDFRVAVRRTRSALSQIKNVFPPETTHRFKQDFAYVGQLSNDLRDLDVYLLAEDVYPAMIPDVLRGDINPLFDHLRQKRGDALKTVVNGFNSKRYAAIMRDWEDFLNAPPPDPPPAPNAALPVITLARNRIYRHYRRIVKTGQEMLTNTDDKKLHRLRLECKKLRYLLEFFTSLFPAKDVAQLTRQLKKLQDNLGNFNDLCVQEEYLMRIAGELPLTDQQSRKTLLAVGSLVDTLHQQRLAVKSEFAQTFATFASPPNRALFKKLFAPPKKETNV